MGRGLLVRLLLAFVVTASALQSNSHSRSKSTFAQSHTQSQRQSGTQNALIPLSGMNGHVFDLGLANANGHGNRVELAQRVHALHDSVSLATPPQAASTMAALHLPKQSVHVPYPTKLRTGPGNTDGSNNNRNHGGGGEVVSDPSATWVGKPFPRTQDWMRDSRTNPSSLRPHAVRNQNHDKELDQLLWAGFESRVHVNNHLTKPELVGRLDDLLHQLAGLLATDLQVPGDNSVLGKLTALQNATDHCYPSNMTSLFQQLFPHRKVVHAQPGTKAVTVDKQRAPLIAGTKGKGVAPQHKGTETESRGTDGGGNSDGNRDEALGFAVAGGRSPLLGVEATTLDSMWDELALLLGKMDAFRTANSGRAEPLHALLAVDFVINTGEQLVDKIEAARGSFAFVVVVEKSCPVLQMPLCFESTTFAMAFGQKSAIAWESFLLMSCVRGAFFWQSTFPESVKSFCLHAQTTCMCKSAFGSV